MGSIFLCMYRFTACHPHTTSTSETASSGNGRTRRGNTSLYRLRSQSLICDRNHSGDCVSSQRVRCARFTMMTKWEASMLQCARAGCGATESRLRSGNLYLADVIETDGATAMPRVIRKFVWLCQSCAETHTVQSWRPPGEQICKRPSSHYEAFYATTGLSPGRGERQPSPA